MPGENNSPNQPSLDDSQLREAVKDSDEMDSLSETLGDLTEMLKVMEQEQAAKDAVTLDLIPPVERQFLEDMVGVMILSSTGNIYYVTGYYATSRDRRFDDEGFTREGALALVLLDPGEESESERGSMSYWFTSKFEKPSLAIPYSCLPETGAPSPESNEVYEISEASSFILREREERFIGLHNSGVFEDLNVGGFDNRDLLVEALDISENNIGSYIDSILDEN